MTMEDSGAIGLLIVLGLGAVVVWWMLRAPSDIVAAQNPPQTSCQKGGSGGAFVGAAGSKVTGGTVSGNQVCSAFLAVGNSVIKPVTVGIAKGIEKIPVVGGLVSSTGNRADASSEWQQRLGPPPAGSKTPWTSLPITGSWVTKGVVVR